MLIPAASLALLSCSSMPTSTELEAPVWPVASRSALDPTSLPTVRWPAQLPPSKAFPKTEAYTFKLKHMPVISVVEALSRSEGFSFEGDRCAQTPISLYLKQVSAKQAIEHMAQIIDADLIWQHRHVRLVCSTPYFVSYKVDYPAIERTTTDSIVVSSQLGSGAGNVTGTSALNQNLGGQPGLNNPNGASLVVQTRHQNRFWGELINAVSMLIRDQPVTVPAPLTTETTITQQVEGQGLVTDSRGRVRRSDVLQGTAVLPLNGETTTSKRTVTQQTPLNSDVVAHPESGLLVVRGTQRQHQRVEQFLQTVNQRALKQVLIEATVAEVKLSSRYQKGIQWRAMRGDAERLGLNMGPAPSQENQGGLAVLRYVKPPGLGDSIGVSAALSLLETFGDVRVISNPKLAVLNQQTAVMKVVDNRVYFTVQVQTSAPTTASAAFSTFNTQVHTVPVGFFMAVTPHIEDNAGVSLTVRPTVSRIVGFVNDPNPSLAQAGVTSRIPEIQTREIESVMRLQSGEIALLGGLMQTSQDRSLEGLPGAAKQPWMQALTGQQRSDQERTELVVLLRPVVQPVTQSVNLPTPFQQPGGRP